jgi:hypothetical protein
LALALPLVLLLSVAAPLGAQTTEPFTGQGEGIILDEQVGTFYFAVEGLGEPLGHFGGEGAFIVPDHGLFGKITLFNADQDKVFAAFIGEVLDDGSYAATLFIQGGAGRFTGASGMADLWGEFFDDGSFTINFDGTITY